MSRKIFITIPMLCLSLQSTGYASALRELVELGTPLKRVMSMLRPVVPLAREYSSTSRLSAYINPVPQNPLIQRSFTTLPINRLTTNMSSVVPFPRVLDESKRITLAHIRPYATSSSIDSDLRAAYNKAQTNCWPTLKKAFPDRKGFFDRINSNFHTFLNYEEKNSLDKFMTGSTFPQLAELEEQWAVFWKKSPSSVDLTVIESKEGIDYIFKGIISKANRLS
jgi:hypothetical protein